MTTWYHVTGMFISEVIIIYLPLKGKAAHGVVDPIPGHPRVSLPNLRHGMSVCALHRPTWVS